MANRMYKTLPTAFKGKGGSSGSNNNEFDASNLKEKRKTTGRIQDASVSTSSSASSQSSSSSNAMFSGLNLNLGISNLISGGISLLGQLRKKTPANTPVHLSKSMSVNPKEDKKSSLRRSTSSSTTANSSLASTPSKDEMFFDAYEHIELRSFPSVPDPAGEGQTGKGHVFVPIGSFNPTWCDLCGDLIWGLYDTGASRCQYCNFTCHIKCQRKVRLNCSILQGDQNLPGSFDPVAMQTIHLDKNKPIDFDESTLANLSTLKSEELVPDLDDDNEDTRTLKDVDHILIEHDDELVMSSNNENTLTENEVSSKFLSFSDLPLNSNKMFGDHLASVVAKYNAISPPGQETFIEGDNESCRGFIRVLLNLRRPINVISGTKPPSIYNIMKKDDTIEEKSSLTSFYLPPDTVKALHVSSETTTREVIRSLLDKFRVADTPHKYALYEKTLATSLPDDAEADLDDDFGESLRIRTLSRVRMRKLRDEERPLVLALVWCRDNVAAEKCLVLQENDPGEISWDSFSMPELKNFLLILDREEAWYKKRIHDRYEAVRDRLQELVNEKNPASSTSPDS